MILFDTKRAFGLSIMPAVIASSCCLTIPALALLGFSFSENIFFEYKAHLRLAAFFVMLASLVAYFYYHNIRGRAAIRENKNLILAISLQTLVYALIIYAAFLYLLVPGLCQGLGIGTCSSI